MALWQEGELIAIAPFCVIHKIFFISLIELKQQFNFQFMGLLLSTLLERFFHTEEVDTFIPLIQTNPCIKEELFTGLGFDCNAIGEYEFSNNP